MLEMTAAAATPERLSDDAAQKPGRIIFGQSTLNADGQCYWSVDLPDEVPKVTLFKMSHCFQKDILKIIRFLSGTPMMDCWCWGYPKDRYTKLTSNYYSISALRRLPVFVLGMLGLDVLCLFLCLLFLQTQNHSIIPNRSYLPWKLGRWKASLTSYQRRTVDIKQCKQASSIFESAK